MEKISHSASNAFCPQALYLYGTYTADGRANYGLFCWAAYCAGNGMKFVACIGEDKLTRDRIRETGVFSATVVTEKLLSAADFCGNTSGRYVDKSAVIPSEKGAVLNVPVPCDGQWTLELKVEHVLAPKDRPDSEIYICSMVNEIADTRLLDPALSFEEKLDILRPVVTMDCKYVPTAAKSLGGWGEPMKAIGSEQ